jgi:dihydroflavonol-4-reductase
MTTLVTGATGFIGSALVRQLLRVGHQVRVLVRSTSNLRNLEGLPVETVRGDLTERSSLNQALIGCKVLFHVAADYRLWVLEPDKMYESNVAGTRNVMLAAADAGVERIVYTSSVATLGLRPDGLPADEKTPSVLEDMIGHYKRSKFLAEAAVQALVKEQGLPVIIVNPSTPIGPRDIKPTPTGRMIVEAASGRIPAFVNTGLNLVNVDDVAIGHRLALEHGRIGERYILGGENLTLQAILTQIAILVGRRPPRLRLHPAVVLPIAHLAEIWARLVSAKEPLITVDGVRLARKPMFFSSDKAKRELGFNPQPVKEALAAAITWFRHHGYCP